MGAQRTRQDIERQRREAEQQAQKTLDRDAIGVVAETQRAIKAISENRNDDAVAAIERATGKSSILLAQNPAAGLVPVDLEVEVIDAAPADFQAIRDRTKAVERAIGDHDYPAARVLLLGLTSEIRTRTYNLPLGTFPGALKEAARLLEQKHGNEAAATLQTALNTLVVVDRATPLPLITAQAAIEDAQAMKDKDRDGALRLLSVARTELERTRALGYLGNDPEFNALASTISDVESQIKGQGDSTSLFGRLKEKLSAFSKRQAETVRR
ncbi:Hypothetical protein A7982_05257 [Minicystis rosea]|nr:Hypothetical protein A7982_05257 [Minicystis rosea]